MGRGKRSQFFPAHLDLPGTSLSEQAMELLLEEEFWHTRPQSLRTACFPTALDPEWAEHMRALDVEGNPQPVPLSEDTVLELLAEIQLACLAPSSSAG